MDKPIILEMHKKQRDQQELAVLALYGVLERIDSAIDHVEVAGSHPAAKSAIASLVACKDKIAVEILNLKRRRAKFSQTLY